MSTTPTPALAATSVVVPVSSPLHPAYPTWLEILLTALRAASAIGPAVVAVVNPQEAQVAAQLGTIASTSLSAVPQ